MSVDRARFESAKDDTGAVDDDEAFLVAVRRRDRCVLPSILKGAWRGRGDEKQGIQTRIQQEAQVI
jgi:hypothetical protein